MSVTVLSFVTRVLDAIGLKSLLTAAWSLPPTQRVWLGAGTAFLGMLFLTPLVIRWAHWRGWVARPQDDRWHDGTVALMGGIAIFGASAAALWISDVLSAFPWPVWIGTILVFGAGLLDDLWEVRPEAKLVVQILATALLLYAGYAFWRGGPFWVSVPLTFLWVIGITNALNLIDGMDGLAAGITAVAAAVLSLVAWLLGHPELAVVSAVLAGAAAGFLVFNFQPARIFMGDCGSMLLGYLLAVVALTAQHSGGPVAATLVPVVVLAVPIFDTTFVTVTRILKGQPVSQGGNDHTMHRLVLLGLSERRTVLLLCGVSGAFGLSALAVYYSTAQLFYAFVLLAVVASMVFALYLANARTYGAAAPTLRVKPPSFVQRTGALMQALLGGVYWKSIVGMVADLLLVVAAFIAAFHLRYDGFPPPAEQELMLNALPGVVGLKIAVFYALGLYHGIWRHAGTPELVRLVSASALASALVLGVWTVFFGVAQVSLALAFLDWMIATACIAGVRFGFRGLRQYFAAQRRGGRRVLVYGTGPSGLLALRHFRQKLALGRTVVGFIDDDPSKQGLRVQGLYVLGSPYELPDLCAEHDVDEIVVPTGDIPRDRQRYVSIRCNDLDISCHHFSLSLRPAALQLEAPGASGDGAPENGAPENGAPENGAPENGTPDGQAAAEENASEEHASGDGTTTYRSGNGSVFDRTHQQRP